MGATVNTPEASATVQALLLNLFPGQYELDQNEDEVVVRRTPAEHHDTIVEARIKPDGSVYVLSRLLDEDAWSHMWQVKQGTATRIIEFDEVGNVVSEEDDEAFEARRRAMIATDGETVAGFLR